MNLQLYEHQMDALRKLESGKILYGGVGSGKSRTALAWYYLENGGGEECLYGFKGYIKMDPKPADLYIITTAKKRDNFEWESEMAPFLITRTEELKIYDHTVVVDSWNNIKKYKDVKGAYFLFDEQRVVGSGAWVDAFLKISKSNKWILLSATPGDKWSDYIPVFVANGFYKNPSEFNREHVVFKPYVSYPVIDKYICVQRLLRLRRKILVPMNFEKKTKRHDNAVSCNFDQATYKYVMKERVDIFKDEPIETAAALCYTLRRIVNTDESRGLQVLNILKERHRAIIFYNYDYELDILKDLFADKDVLVAEWNGHKHQDVPVTWDPEQNRDRDWVYLVQYNAGAEGWNCTTTDTIIFYSQTYSYKQLEQSKGRIDRLNTPYKDLYYYHLKSSAPIDMAIRKALNNKKKFNEGAFVNGNKRQRS